MKDEGFEDLWKNRVLNRNIISYIKGTIVCL
jgi:hypothetical protein